MTDRIPTKGLDAQGIETSAEIYWNLTTAPLVEQAIERGEGKLTKDGALLVDTGKGKGRRRSSRRCSKTFKMMLFWNL